MGANSIFYIIFFCSFDRYLLQSLLLSSTTLRCLTVIYCIFFGSMYSFLKSCICTYTNTYNAHFWFWDNYVFICRCKKQCWEILCIQFLLVVTNCKTIVQYHNKEVDINTVKIHNNFITTKIPSLALLWAYHFLPFLLHFP